MANDEQASLHHSCTPPIRIEVAAGLIFREGRVLIAQRFPDAHLGGLWEFPGGKRLPGETSTECLRRELLEELGVDVEVAELVESITHAYPEKTVHLEFYRCVLVRHEPRPLGCCDLAWVTAQQFSDYAFPAADERLLQKLAATVDLWR